MLGRTFNAKWAHRIAIIRCADLGGNECEADVAVDREFVELD